MSSSTTGNFATKRPTRRSKPRRPAAPATGTGTGPIRPLKKPPPAPTGVTCGYGICCHFGLTCVNPHSPEEVWFFVQRRDLRLQLRDIDRRRWPFKSKARKFSTRKPNWHRGTLVRVAPTREGQRTATPNRAVRSELSRGSKVYYYSHES